MVHNHLHWPSLKDQLREAGAPAGSALEELIKDNQDFHLLAPQESHDNYGLPPWLRVHWRKAHPDLPHLKDNPGAAYPDVLHKVHAWMLSHPDSPLGSAGSQPTGIKGGKP